MTVIMIQSKNNVNFSTTPHRYLFHLMNPFTLGIFNKQDNPRPVIRMVYALASRKPIVQVMERGQPPSERDSKDKGKGKGKSRGRSSIHSFTSFDIWCGHTSSSTFGAIRPEDNETYRELLKRSKDVVEMFEPGQQSMKDVTMSMYPGATSKDAHWTSFFNLKGAANPAPLDDKDLGESDSDDKWEQSIGGYASSPNPQSAGPSFTDNRSVTMCSASPEKHTSSSKLEPADLSSGDNRGTTGRSQRVTKLARPVCPTTEPSTKRQKKSTRR